MLVWRVVRNKYVFVTLAYIIWAGFLDDFSFWRHLRLRWQLRDIRKQISYYEERKQRLQEAVQSTLSSEEALTRFLREVHYMKRTDEDIFIVREED